MAIYTATRGEVVARPVPITTDTGGATVLVLRDFQSTAPGGIGGPDGPGVEYQLCFREPELGRQVLQRVRLGDRLIALGTLELHAVAGPLEDPVSAARITLDAVAVGLDLATPK